MPQDASISQIAKTAARAIKETFVSYRAQFDEVTTRAQSRFQALDWQGMRADTTARLILYKSEVSKIENTIRQLLGDQIEDKRVWASLKAVYAGLVSSRRDRELAETFFNSVSRRIFATVGVDPQIEFVDTDGNPSTDCTQADGYRSYPGGNSATDLIRRILAGYPLANGLENLQRDAARAAAKIEADLHEIGLPPAIDCIEVMDSVFFRGMGAYIIGRMFCGRQLVPLAIALMNSASGIIVDAVLLKENDISILFSFTRSYFHVESASPQELIGFLKTLLPHKRVAELYTAIGFNKHGKTILYRELLGHLSECREERFQLSPGESGLVMIVFNMPNDDLVFKLIRDRFGRPKKITRQEVKRKYQLVFEHDRAGRLIDAQDFEFLKLDDCFFAPQLLAELQSEAAQTVTIENDHVILSHAYVERRVVPLNIYLQEAQAAAARKAVIDFGAAIKDLAVSNIFPGDILLKNFGVTRHGRVVFYDYDELCPLTACNFRKIPPSASYEDELASEPWYVVGENDVFPQEFRYFLGLPDHLLQIFLEHHSDLLDVDFWQKSQAAIRAGELPHIFPYTQSRRLDKSHLENTSNAQ
ncbi:MAG: bifunctional isocitrate dehydrogenase kinase/phosphatase [Desulfobacterales bacterium]|jgi:isocitrate dehydrogenase kinase/phosphatase